MKQKQLSGREKSVSILLGAGFSIPAGMPSANNLSKCILSEICYQKWLSFQDGQDEMLRSFILENALTEYGECEHFNYEQFFGFLEKEKLKSLDSEKLSQFLKRGMITCFKKQTSDKEGRERQICTMQKAIINRCADYSDSVESVKEWYQYLIAKNLLGSSKNGKLNQFNSCYRAFVNTLQKYFNEQYIINIFTLNHDLVLESILQYTDLNKEVSTGFGGSISEINNKEYKEFGEEYYNKQIRIYKLHGSIDIHELSFFNSSAKKYIKMINGYSDSNAFMINQKKEASILPLFLTGCQKQHNYSKEPYYTLLNLFSLGLSQSEKLIVIGYGGRDERINEIVLENYDCKAKKVFVFDPSPSEKLKNFASQLNAKIIEKGVAEITKEDFASW